MHVCTAASLHTLTEADTTYLCVRMCPHTARCVSSSYYMSVLLLLLHRTHARTHARTHSLTHARTHARMHARTHACTHELTEILQQTLVAQPPGRVVAPAV